MGTQIIRCSEVFKNKACVSILFDPAANVNGSLESRGGTLRITDMCETQNFVERAWLESLSGGLC